MVASLPSRLWRARSLLAAAAFASAVAGCDQTLESGLACPALCPQLGDTLRDTTLYAVVYDTSVGIYPTTGQENALLLMTHAGVYDTRAIIRFDSLLTRFHYEGSVDEYDIVALDTAMLKLLVARADTLGPDVTVEVYDVDTIIDAQSDTSVAVLAPLFTPARLLGTRTFTADSMRDTLRIPIDKAKLLTKLTVDTLRRLRVGVRVQGPGPSEVTVFSGNGGAPPMLFFQPTADTAQSDTSAAPLALPPLSKTPDDGVAAVELADFVLLVLGSPPPPTDVFRVGGAPGSRAYLRFDIPSQILDSSAIVRSTLILTQRPNALAPNATDTVGIAPFELVASPVVTDLRRVLTFLAFAGDTVGVTPTDGGERSFEMIDAIRRWRFTDPARTPRAIALLARTEGLRAWHADFYSQRAALALRPRLRVTYIPQPRPGLP